jgi:hypothetical protein
MRRHAYEESAQLFRQALDIGAAELDEPGRCGLLSALAAALSRSSDIPGALEAYLEATALGRRLGRPDLVAEAALVLSPPSSRRST